MPFKTLTLVQGIAFLSGGQSPEIATLRLNEMNLRSRSHLPWPLTFSFSRAIQQPALEVWRGKEANVFIAQKVLYDRAKACLMARNGEYEKPLT